MGEYERAKGKVNFELGTLQAEQEERQRREAEQMVREKLIAEYHDIVGRIKGAKMVADFGSVSYMLWIQQVHVRKLYKDIPGAGTWERFCESLGSSRSKIEHNLANLTELGETFLATVNAFGVGYRDLRKLRHLVADGTLQIEDNCIVIEDQQIPLNDVDEVQAAVENLLQANRNITQRLERLEKHKDAIVKEETKGLVAEKKALLEKVERLEVFAPTEHDLTWCEEQMKVIHDDCQTLTSRITMFVVDPRLQGDRAAQAQVLCHINEAEMMLSDLRDRFAVQFPYGE